jgi:two-component system, NarL family, sensor histidine kinase UhpB
MSVKVHSRHGHVWERSSHAFFRLRAAAAQPVHCFSNVLTDSMDTSMVVPVGAAHAPLHVASEDANRRASGDAAAAPLHSHAAPGAPRLPASANARCANHAAASPSGSADHEELARLRARVRELSAQVVSAHEAVRRQLAQDLHDSAGAELTASRFALANVATWLPGDAAPQCATALALAQRSLDAAAEATRSAIDDLHAPPLEHGIVHALAQWIDSFAARTGLRTSFICSADARVTQLPADAALAVFRVAQEALNNVAKHARASSADVRIETTREHLTLSISDDGIGMRRGTGKQRHRFGLSGMSARCEAYHGTLNLDAAPERASAARGTAVHAQFAWHALLASAARAPRRRAARHS